MQENISYCSSITTKNENLRLEKNEGNVFDCLCTHLRKFVYKIIPLWLKNPNQRVRTGGLMRSRRGAYMRGLIRGATDVLQ